MKSFCLSFSVSLFYRVCFSQDIWRRNCNTTCSCGLLYSLVAHIYTGCADRAAWRFLCGEVDRLFPCSVSVCVRASLCAVNKICFYPQTMANRALLCVWRLHTKFFHGLLGMVSCHGNWWDVVHYDSSFFSKKKEAGCKFTLPTKIR